MASQWGNQTDIRSGTSSRIYTVAQRIGTGWQPELRGTWGCSCPGYLSYRKCKHLTTAGLDGGPPLPPRTRRAIGTDTRTPEQRAATRSRFSDEAYRHYNTSHGYGSAEEWIEALAAKANRKGKFKAPPPPPRTPRTPRQPKIDPDLVTLDLTTMPEEPHDLAKAMKRASRSAHPDYKGGSAEKFDEVRKAYERLLAKYPPKSRSTRWGATA